MRAIGQETGKIYSESDISDKEKFAEMKSEPLASEHDPDSVVVPVRASTPHFRTLSTLRQVRVGKGEPDETHNATITMLHKHFDSTRIKLVTYVFTNGTSDTQVLFDSKSAYEWWPDGDGNRISFQGGDYIQPDLCGRDASTFCQTRKKRALLVEVINTHIPDHKTLQYLVQLSEQNYIIAFYYVSKDRKFSKYNSFVLGKKYVELRTAYYLMDGVFYKNDQPVIAQTATQDILWYQNVKSTYFDPALVAK
ncbi:hypothetical protein AB4Z32_17105 [Massilia sp. 2TAF26]|uniref:hypothetical protein n=1 Tax=Massilia sp. 2TAF26 TaxID=3233012 RepID=UPI003F9705B7